MKPELNIKAETRSEMFERHNDEFCAWYDGRSAENFHEMTMRQNDEFSAWYAVSQIGRIAA